MDLRIHFGYLDRNTTSVTIYFLNLKLATYNHHLNLVLEIKKWFSKLFSPEWEGKTVLQTLQFRMERENDSLSSSV
ncbi:hypothetical protein C1645_837756 [Glomus cerebriforme]|uniref:Uncharacterized protein n=1 Tax=Glomus cerebriforme TaxID=658196 RepID=A0A397S8A6_9GLOM|nr:hypothetical protein C1645_837756 [Glomus cerebriforme]